ncbi:MAG: M14 family zinc carboxypeptidase, partial [Emcibacteraceae bacterium]|nr:M14 family zinc carboxypeptidase [Emcibacteraceae bacterium]
MKFLYLTITAALLFGTSVTLNAAESSNIKIFPEDINYNPDIPRPAEIIGHPLGHRVARHDLLLSYMRTVADKSDRVMVETIAKTHEGRDILMLTISSPENLARIDEIKKAHVALSMPGSTQEVSDDMPVVTWLNYGVHGAEVSSTDSSMAVAYNLAAAESDYIKETLDNSVVLLIAIFNPDGNARQSAWNHSYGSNVSITDPNGLNHNTAWPGGRTNHYWFDLNRQWLLQQHPGPQGWVKKFHEWKPNLSADHHEMGTNSTFYIPPGVPHRTFPYIPTESIDLLEEVTNRPRDFMDSEARLYFSEEGYDNFYIGKGATYPHMNAGIGMLFEQARTLGEVDTVHGRMSFRDNVRTYLNISLSVVKAGLELRPRLLDYQKRFYNNAIDLAKKDDVKGYIFASPKDKARGFHFRDMLNRHQIDVNIMDRDVTVDGKVYKAGKSFMVKTSQKQYTLIKGIFEKITSFENNTFYDVSGFTMPLTFGMDYAATSGRELSSAGNIVSPAFESAPAVERATAAYIFEWNEYYSPRALNRLLQAGVRPKVATKPFAINTSTSKIDMAQGSIMVSTGWQGSELSDDELHTLMQTIANKDGIKIHAVGSIRTPTAGMDLGSRNFMRIENPKILLMVGEGTRAYDAGEVWHLLDYRMNIPVTLYEKSKLKSLDITDYTHIIFVGGTYNAKDETLSKKIKSWVRSGGTVIAHRQGAKWAGEILLGIKDEKEEYPMDRQNYADKTPNEVETIVGGAIMRGDLDNTHPIGFGYHSREVYTHRDTTIAFEQPKNPYATVVSIPENALASGFASEDNQARLAGKANVVAERLGQGSVILFA